MIIFPSQVMLVFNLRQNHLMFLFLFLFFCRYFKEDKTVWDFPWELREGGETVRISNLAVTHGCLTTKLGKS